MKLLFKNDTGFSADLKAALGFIDANITYQQIRPDLFTATKDVVSVIGKPTYQAIIAASEKAAPTDDEETLVILAKSAIASQSYRYFAPKNDLAHTPNGRKMRNSTDEANPFEWMVVKNNDELQRQAYRALDDLIDHMDETLPAWKSSEAYKEANNLFIRKTTEFDTFFTIGSRLLLIKLSPGISICERDEILPRVGEELFTSLKQKRKEGAPLNAPEKKLLSIIQEACAYSSLAWGLPRLQMQLFPEGILHAVRSERAIVSSRKAAAAMEVDSMAQHFKVDADKALLRLEELIKSNAPEPTEEVCVSDLLPISSSKNDKYFSS